MGGVLARGGGGWGGVGQGMTTTMVGNSQEVQRRNVEQVFREMKTGADLDEVVPRAFFSSLRFSLLSLMRGLT